MKLIIKTEIEFTPIRLIVAACPRYWEDASINGISDTEDGDKMPFHENARWRPVIELETGRVIWWPWGMNADIHYKVCDAVEYWLEDAEGKRVKWRGEYVPGFLSVGERGYGDYIIMKISEEGIIEGWSEPALNGEDWKVV